MIGDAVVSFFEWLVTTVLGLFPALPDIGSVTASVSSGMSTLVGYAAGLSSFIPWSFLASCTALVLGVLATAVVIKVVRIVASFFTAGGGSAA